MEWNIIFVDFIDCKLRQITHKLNIKHLVSDLPEFKHQ